jgi:hypothetical protein
MLPEPEDELRAAKWTIDEQRGRIAELETQLATMTRKAKSMAELADALRLMGIDLEMKIARVSKIVVDLRNRAENHGGDGGWSDGILDAVKAIEVALNWKEPTTELTKEQP